MKKSYELDMTTGAILPKMLQFCFPLMFTGILQLLFNAADVFVVGKYVGAVAMAAVGTSGPIINLLVNLFLGLSVGVNVAVARYIGANRRKDVEELLLQPTLRLCFRDFCSFLLEIYLFPRLSWG